MPVFTLSSAHSNPAFFVVCDNRSDTNRVLIAPDALEQWQANPLAITRFIASVLSLRYSGKSLAGSTLIEIGLARGDERAQMLCLSASKALTLVAGDNRLPLVDVIRFEGGVYSLDQALIRLLVDNSTVADDRYTPSTVRREAGKLGTEAMRDEWRKAYRKLKKERPKMSKTWYAQQIAKMEIAKGRGVATIRKQLPG